MCVRCVVSPRVPVCSDVCPVFSYRGLSRWPISDSSAYYIHGLARLSTLFAPLQRLFFLFLSWREAIGGCGLPHMTLVRSRSATRESKHRRDTLRLRARRP